MNSALPAKAAKVAANQYAPFKWDDPFLFDEQLNEDERMVQASARAYCQEKLMPRVIESFRHEKFDRAIMNEMGEMVRKTCTELIAKFEDKGGCDFIHDFAAVFSRHHDIRHDEIDEISLL